MRRFMIGRRRDIWVFSRIVILVFLFCSEVSAQLVVTEAATSAEVEQYVEDVLLGACVTVSNFSYTGQAWGSGTFNGSASNIGMNSGIIMTTGRASYAVGPDNVDDRSHNQSNAGDADLDQLLNFGFTTEDAVILEFDFIPQDDTLRFNYIFGSEEYPEYVNSGFNDVFGFFISGPGYAGPFSNGAENIALIPGTTTPVAINNVNNGYSATEPAPGPGTNSAYYVDNGGGATVQYDGFTTVLNALAVVQACETYHIKIAIADAGDHVYDSGVFLQAGSFSAGGGISVEVEASNITPGVYEGCNDAWFIFRRLDLLNNGMPITADYTIGGTATAGIDYTPLANSITIPAGVDSLLVNIAALFDGIPEGIETITLALDDPPCSCEVPEVVVLHILDNDIPLTVSTTGSATICVGQSANLTSNPEGSQTPYSQSWDNGLSSNLNQTVSPTTTTTYTFTVSDACGGQTVTSSETVVVIQANFSIDDYEQCFLGNNFSFTNDGTSNGSVTHFWDFGDGLGSSTQENPTYNYQAAGNYTITHNVILTATMCTTVVASNVDVWELPIVSATSSDVVCAGGNTGSATAIVSSGLLPFGYTWLPGGLTSANITNLTEGTYNVTVTDGHNCVGTSSATIGQNDPIPPVPICQNITVQLNASGNEVISAMEIDNGTSDNCGIASMVVTPNTFDCSDIGPNTVIMTVTDVNGNASTCNSTVTVEDEIPPTALCQNISVLLNASGNASITAAQIDNGSSDTCGIASLSVSPSTFDCSNLGTNTVVLAVTDNSGNVSTCNAIVSVLDTINPTAICQNISVQLDANGEVTIQSVDIDGGSFDNCGIASVTIDGGSISMYFDCSSLGINTVTLTVTDVNGNVSTCDAEVTVEANVDPTAICQDITIQLDANGEATIQSVDIDGGSDDNCGIASVTFDGGSTSMSFDCSDEGVNTITLTVIAVNGNVSTCDAQVTIENNVIPNVLCQDITVYLDAYGDVNIIADDVNGGTNAACGIANFQVAPGDFDCSDLGANTVTLTATDNSGNISNCDAIVTVLDTIIPIVICQNITVQLDANGEVIIQSMDIDGGSSDNCDIASITFDGGATSTSFDCSSLGANTITLIVTDVNGNLSACEAIVTVEDNLNPVTMCQDATIYLDSLGYANISAYTLDNGSSDACGIDTILINQSFYDCSELGVNDGIITVFDVNGNSSTCISNVNVQDTISPYFVDCPIDIILVPEINNCEPLVTWIPPTGLDNCTPTVSSTNNPGDNFPVGTTTVIYTVTDESGNSNTCSFDVTINPVPLSVSITSPEFECGFNITCNGLNDGSIQSFVSGGCLPYTYDWSNGQTGETAINLTGGTYDVTVTDVNGNQATAEITLTEPDSLVITSVTSSVYEGGWNISCPGANDGWVVASIEGGADCEIYTLSWSDLNATYSTIENATGLSVGTYLFHVQDTNGCQAVDSIALTEPDSVELLLDSQVYNGGYNISCAGASDGIIDLTVLYGTPPYSVSWGNGETTEDISGLSAGIYTVNVTDANGCEVISEITLSEPVVLASEITSPTLNGYNISCNGLEDGSLELSVSGGIEPYLYLWNTGDATEVITGLGAGVYPLTIIDSNECVHTDSIELIQPSELVLNSLDTVLLSCNGDIDGSLTVAATGGVSSYSYTWFSGVTGATALNLAAGLYTAYVEDLNGCSDSLLIQLDEPLGLVAQINSQIDISCFEGSNGLVDMGISGGVAPYVFQWTNGETTEDLNGVPAGAYTLTVTDANFCQTQVTAVVNEPTELVLGIDSLVDVTCTGMATGQAWISATGGIEPYTYLWSTGQQTSFVIGLSAGIHQVTVTDSHACSQVISIEIAEPPMIFANLIYISDVGCNGASNGSSIVEVVGGAAPYTYHWSNGDILNLTDSLTGGNQFVVVTDANGCDTTINFIMDEPDVLSVVSALAQDPTCFGDSSGLIQISITGGSEPYYPLWEDGLTTLQADGFGAGDYLVIVTDFNGCEDSLTVTLDEPTQLEIFDMVVIEPLCSGSEDGSAAVIVQGGSAPYFYDWQPSGSTSATPNDLGAGDHIVVITDQHNCLLSHTVSMNPPDLLLALAIEDTAVCPGDAALVWAEATGGVGNYFYLWNQGLGIAQGGEVIPGGTTDYIVTVTDSAGCSSIPDTMTVTLASLPTPSFIYTSPDFCAYPVQLDLENTTAGGETFEWFFGNGDVSDLQNPSISYDDPGIYTITLIAYSDIGCADTTFLTYETSEIPAASFSLDGMEGCSPVIINFQNFSENANTYLWDFGDGSTSVLPDPSHVYDNSGEYDITLVISTPGGCLDTMMLGAGVTVWQSPIADFNPIMMNPDSGAVYQFINLSSGAASYEWDFSNGVSSNLEEPYHDFLINGNFDVLLIAINEFGCIDTALHVVEINVFTGLNVPSALSAGELGETGVFLPKGTGLVQYQAMVFDEWGNLMWESKELENGSPAEGWDGTFKGKRVPQGAYIWKIDAEFFNGHVWEGKEYGREKYRNTGSVSVIY